MNKIKLENDIYRKIAVTERFLFNSLPVNSGQLNLATHVETSQ